MTSHDPTILEHLATGEIEIVGQITWSSNAIFLVEVTSDLLPDVMQAVYKPLRGERPLHDFPPGVSKREVAAFRLGAALSWDLIPETALVEGPLGQGSLQRFVEVDYDEHYFTMFEFATPHVLAQLQRICCFDLLANNTDRKAGHCIIDAQRHVWAIDNALTFHAMPKLRTVIWDFAGEAIDPPLMDDVASLVHGGLPDDLIELLGPFEVDALLARATALLATGTFPHDDTGRAHPWPLV